MTFNACRLILHSGHCWLSFLCLLGIDASAQTGSHEMTIPNDVSTSKSLFLSLLPVKVEACLHTLNSNKRTENLNVDYAVWLGLKLSKSCVWPPYVYKMFWPCLQVFRYFAKQDFKGTLCGLGNMCLNKYLYTCIQGLTLPEPSAHSIIQSPVKSTCYLTLPFFSTTAYWVHHRPPGSQDQWDQANVGCPDQDCKSSGWINWPPGHHHRLTCQHQSGGVPHQRKVR